MLKITVANKRHLRTGVGEYVGRPSALGNPYTIGKDGDRGEVIAKYREWLEARIKVRHHNTISELDRLHRLAEQGELKLLCWCAPDPCHADVIREVLLSWAPQKEGACLL